MTQSTKPDYITRLEFRQGMDAVRDRLDGHFIGLSEKIDTLTNCIQDRFTHLESDVARLDERILLKKNSTCADL
jgi:hypothetical protein